MPHRLEHRHRWLTTHGQPTDGCADTCCTTDEESAVTTPSTPPSAAAELRAAAEKIRATAKAAEPGPWVVGPHWGARENRVYVQAEGAFDWVGTVYGGIRPVPDVFDAAQPVIACQVANKGTFAKANAAHIAMWHPAVAMVIAGWLFAVAIDEGQDAETYHRVKERTTALEVARMINAAATEVTP